MTYLKDDFYIGQRVRIRDWDDMVEEYGVDEVDDTGDPSYIDTPVYCYPLEMRPLCGMTAEIFDIEYIGRDGVHKVLLCNWNNNNGNPTTVVERTGYDHWMFTTAMLKPLESDPEIQVSFDGEAFRRMLGVE